MSGNAGSYSFRVRAEGFAEFVRDLQQVAGESAAAQRAIATLIQSSPQLASAMTAAAEATERAARAAVQQREAQAQAAAATATVTTQVAAGAQGLQTLQDRTLAASRAVSGLQGALQMAGLGELARPAAARWRDHDGERRAARSVRLQRLPAGGGCPRRSTPCHAGGGCGTHRHRRSKAAASWPCATACAHPNYLTSLVRRSHAYPFTLIRGQDTKVR